MSSNCFATNVGWVRSVHSFASDSKRTKMQRWHSNTWHEGAQLKAFLRISTNVVPHAPVVVGIVEPSAVTSAVHANLSETALVPICHGLPTCQSLTSVSHSTATELWHLLILAAVSCTWHCKGISAPLPFWNKKQNTKSSSLSQRSDNDSWNVTRNFCMAQAGPLWVKMADVRCKVMCRCACARHCAVETDTQQGNQQRKLETNLGSSLFQHSSCHCRMTTVMRSHHSSATRQSDICNVHSSLKVETRDV